jgi:hypothetical protein
LQESFDHRARLGAPRNRKQPALNDRDLCSLRDFEPDPDRSLCTPPSRPRLLAGDRNEAEVPDRSAIGLRVPVDHNDTLSTPSGRERVRQPANTCADHREIIRLRRGFYSSNGDLAFNSRRRLRRTLALN